MVRISAGTAAESDASTVTGTTAEREGQLRIEYYTDPLCCWSWALEPTWREIRQHYGASLSWTVVLGGMIESWATFRDPMNDIGAPPQLAPLWHMAGSATGVPIDPAIWHFDPPSSSYPASLAVKAASLQGPDAGDRYLALAREAVMTRRLNIGRRDVLLQLGSELGVLMPTMFDLERFRGDLVGEEALESFRADLQRVRFLRIGRFPTIVAHGPAGSRIAVGYRPADVLQKMLHAVMCKEADDSGTRV